MRRTVSTLVAFACVGAVACGSEPREAERPSTDVRADSVALAMAAFDASVFDTIEWATPEDAVTRGGLVFRISCAKCHGDLGRGDGNFVLAGDTLRPPSFVIEDWRLADAPEELRRYIFSGNVAGMPYWGLVGLKYRDIDAVARYITESLRPSFGM